MGVVHKTIGKVSWGQLVRELKFQTKTFKFIMATVIMEHRKILNRHRNCGAGELMCLDRGYCYRSHFYHSKYVCTCFFGQCQENLWYFPRAIFSLYTSKRETEDPMSISKKCAVSGQGAMTSAQQNRSALGRVCTAHIQLIPMGKADIPSVQWSNT